MREKGTIARAVSHVLPSPMPSILVMVSVALLTISGVLTAFAQSGTTVATPTRTPTVRAAVAVPTATSPVTSKPASSLPNQPAAVPPGFGNSYIGGTVFVDDNLDGSFNGQERGKKDVTVRLTYDSTARGTSSVTTKTNDDGYYEFRELSVGTYLVSVEPPDGFAATTNKQREFTVNGSSTDGTRALNFGLFRTVGGTITTTPGTGSVIGGTVYIDTNRDEIFNGDEDGKDDVSVRLRFSSSSTGTSSVRAETNDDGYYEFRNLAAGTYLVSIDLPDGYESTTNKQREFTVNGSFTDGTRTLNFGIFRAANATATAASASRTAVARGSTSSGSGTTGAGTTGTGVRGTAFQTPTPFPTATATLLPAQKLQTLPQTRSARFFMEGHANDNGILYDYVAIGSALQEGKLDMELAINSSRFNLVALGTQSYLLNEGSETWSQVPTTAVRNWYGVLSPLDVMNLAALDRMVLDVRPTSLIEELDGEQVRRIDVFLVSQVPTPNPLVATYQPGPPQRSSSVGVPVGREPTPQPVNVNITGIYPARADIHSQLGNDPTTGPGVPIPAPAPGQTSTTPTQMQVLDGVVELWVGSMDGLVRAAHLRLNLPSIRQDRPGRLEPVWQDTWVWYSEINEPFTITAPTNLAPPTPHPALATAIARATDDARTVTGLPTSGPIPLPVPVRPAPSGASPGGAPASGVPGAATPQSIATLEPGPFGVSDAVIAAAERALLALASASGPRTGSTVTETGIMLDVPWRGTTDPSGATIATDGPTALGMILESYGVTAPTADLQALAERWAEPRTDGDSVPIETLVRIAERGALRPIGTGRGPGGGDWTAAMARDFIRRGYPVLALVRPQVLSGADVTPDQADRYIVLVGYDGTDLIYHDPAVINGAARRVDPVTLDRAWQNATPPRQGVVFGFGAGIIGLLDGPGRSAQLRPDGTATAQAVATRTTPTILVEPTAVVIEPTPSEVGGPHPALLAFLGVLAAGVGFLIARLYR